MLAQGDPDQDASPGGMLESQGQCGLTDLIRGGVGKVLWRVIVGPDAVRSTVAKSLGQVAYGARSKAEGRREAGGGLPLLSPLEELATHGKGHRRWHGEVLRPEGGG